MSVCVNEAGLTFLAWHESAGYTISWLARCDRRFFGRLHLAWRQGDAPKDWRGAESTTGQPWD